MAADSSSTDSSETTWTVLGSFDRDGHTSLEVVLVEAFGKLEPLDESEVLYDYVDVEALDAILPHETGEPGATEVHFPYKGHTIRVTAEGTVEAR